MEDKEIYGRIYLITNLINRKQYVGQTVKSIKHRFKQHCKISKSYISKAIKKYGKENFIIKEIDIAYSQQELNKLEGVHITCLNTLVPNGYNLTNIIQGKGKVNKETREKMKIAANTEEKLKISAENGKKTRGKSRENSSSKYAGVCFLRNRWCSQINFNNKNKYIGMFFTEDDAAKAYDIVAIKSYGHNCNLNFPELRHDYINGKIIVNKNTLQNHSRSKIKNISYHKQSNKWRFVWLDKNLNKNKTKNFKTLEEAIEFKNEIELL